MTIFLNEVLIGSVIQREHLTLLSSFTICRALNYDESSEKYSEFWKFLSDVVFVT